MPGVKPRVMRVVGIRPAAPLPLAPIVCGKKPALFPPGSRRGLLGAQAKQPSMAWVPTRLCTVHNSGTRFPPSSAIPQVDWALGGVCLFALIIS